MGEPVVYYDINGDEIVLHSPQVARAKVNSGELFDAPPLIVEEAEDEEE